MGSGKKVTVGYKYFMGIHMGISRGPVNSIVAIEAGGKPVWSGNITSSGTVAINKPDLFGGEMKEGGIDGTLHVLMGGPEQTAPAPLVAMLGGDVPGFRGMCTLFFDGMLSSMTPYIKPWKIRVRRSTAGWDGGAWYPEKALIVLAGGAIHAMNPAHIIYESLTNRQWSRGMPRDRINDASFRAAADTLHSEGFGLCLRWTRQESVSSFIQTVLDHIGATLYQSRFDGLFHLSLIREDYAASALPLFDENAGLLAIDDDESTAASGATNEVIVQWHDPVSDKDRQWRERNLAAVHADGQISSQTVRLPGIPTADLAGRIAVRELRQRSGLLKRFKVRLDRRGYRINPGDAFRIRSLRRGISDMVVRAGRIEDGTLTSASITVTVVQDVFGLPATSMSAPQPLGWLPPDTTPAAVVQRRLVELTWRDIAATTDAANLAIIGSGVCRLGILAARPTSMSLGYALETRVGASDWADQGTGDWVASGLLVSAIGRGDVAFALSSGTDLDRVVVGSVAMLGAEIVRIVTWSAGTQSGTFARGCVDTVPTSHAAGDRLWILPDGVPDSDPTDYAPSVTVQARLLTHTSAGKLAAALAATDSLLLTRRADRPYPPGRVRINGVANPSSVTGAVTVTWTHRDRKLQADQVIDTEQGNIGPEPGTLYRLRLYNGATLVRTYSGIAGTSQTYAADHEATDGGPFNPLRIVLDAERDGLYSAQAHDIIVGRM